MLAPKSRNPEPKMATERRAKSPRQVAVVIAAFFLAYGVYARWFAAEEHPIYAGAAWGMGIVWLILALLAHGERRK